MRSKFFFTILLCVCVISITTYGWSMPFSGNPIRPVLKSADTIIKGNFNIAAQLKFNSASISGFLQSHQAFESFRSDFVKFYSAKNYHYVWYDNNGLTEPARNLINHLSIQQSDGILNEIPYQRQFLHLIDSIQNLGSNKPVLSVELMLTGQYFSYAKNAWSGAEAEKAGRIGWYLPRKKLSYLDLLEKNLKSSADSVEQVAVIPQYIMLKKALNRYQEIERSGPDIVVPENAGLSALVPGNASVLIVQLKNRLKQLGDLTGGSSSKLWDDELSKAILHFKVRHGLSPNNHLNTAFLKQLNVPIRKRIEQMIVNLERMRWVPADDHGGEFLLVNIPEFKLHYFINNRLDWSCNVVVGKVMTKTVIFSGHLQYIVFSPYWYVPQSIIQKDIKSGMARNDKYLANHNMEWNGGHVRQKPGESNSLGLVKFIFPNTNNIYLHDTPSKALFNEDVRAFSHGCIRVSKPKELATRILKNYPAWTSLKIDAAMHGGREQTVILKNKIPVYIGYFTAFVNSEGILNFRSDIYNRDPSLLSLLMHKEK